MKTRTVVQLIIAAFILYIAWFVAKPFVDKYRIEKVVENIAQYCTINSIERTEQEFSNRIVDLGRKDITAGMLYLEKDDETQQVKARLLYKDKIEIFGILIKSFEFEIKKEAAKVDKII